MKLGPDYILFPSPQSGNHWKSSTVVSMNTFGLLSSMNFQWLIEIERQCVLDRGNMQIIHGHRGVIDLSVEGR